MGLILAFTVIVMAIITIIWTFPWDSESDMFEFWCICSIVIAVAGVLVVVIITLITIVTK
jgi:hypothetical protein